MIVIGVTCDGHVITTEGCVLVADTVEQWHEHWQGMQIGGQAVLLATIDAAALTPSFPIAEWGKGRSPVNSARDSLARARDAAAVVWRELQRELGEHPATDAEPAPE